MYPELTMLIDGTWLPRGSRSARPVIDPSTGSSIALLPLATPADLDRAIDAAHRSFPLWRAFAPEQRGTFMHRAAHLLRQRKDNIARWLTLEEGKPLSEALEEVEFSADIIDFFAAESLRAYGTTLPAAGRGSRTMVVLEPVGPVAAFTPWNYPVTVPARKIAAALAAGCTIVIKPAEETPASALAVVQAFFDAGLPAGVLNLVFGDPAEVSEHLIASPAIRKVSFTGPTIIGKHIARLASDGVKPCILELGGHAPALIFDDVDVDHVAQLAVQAKFYNSGQSCGAPSRFYVQEPVYERFVQVFAEHTSALTVGNGNASGSDVGPLRNERRVKAMDRLVSDAIDHGARLVTGGPSEHKEGFYWTPTLLADVPEDADVMTEEPFGPIAAVASFSTTNEGVAKANRLPYGLGSFVFTTSLETATNVPHLLEAGMVGVNTFSLGGRDTYFGGVKESGYGSEGGPEAMRDYMVRKLITQL
ncbi:MAG TPA: NAD-dependent succinate-semialdehyde dehydrogenase [Acidothermaceae bacterium]